MQRYDEKQNRTRFFAKKVDKNPLLLTQIKSSTQKSTVQNVYI